MEDTKMELGLAATILVADLVVLMNAKKKKPRRYWMKSWMAGKSKNVYNLLQEMSLGDEQDLYEYHWMYKRNFAELLDLVSPLIKKQDTKMKEAVSPAQRFSITLGYLATG